jgi:hypothetical protein
MKGVCEDCGCLAEYADSVPDASVSGHTPTEAGYRWKPLCWAHAVERRQVATSRVTPILVGADGVGHVDRDRAGGDCVCMHCGRKYYDHPQARPDWPYLNLLCDGSLVKL